MNSPIAISLSPNTDKKDVFTALKAIVNFWSPQEGSKVEEVEKWFSQYYKSKISLSFNSGRSALYAVLKAFDVKKGDEVILQAFTCVAVPDAILWTGAKPVFADIDGSFNLDLSEVEKKITSETRAIIVQHTFGIPAQITKIKLLARKHNIILIEDCAHALGATVDNKLLGTYGDAAVFSFGRDKIISSVFGGLAIINNDYSGAVAQLKKFHEKLDYPPHFWILQQLLHPIFFSFILPVYSLNIGKAILYILQRLHVLSKPIYAEEYVGEKPSIFPKKFPNALAKILLYQLSKLKKMNKKREEIADFYYQSLKNIKEITSFKPVAGAVYLRYPILAKNTSDILKFSKKEKIILGNWYHHIIDPKQVDYLKVGYQIGSCPKAESVSKQIVNLPTYFRLRIKDVQRVVDLIKKTYD